MRGMAHVQTITVSHALVYREILRIVYAWHVNVQRFEISRDLVFREIMNMIYAWCAYIQGTWIIQSVKRRAMGLSAGIRIPIAVGDFCQLHSVLTGSESQPDSYPMGTRGYFPPGKSGWSLKLTNHLHLVSRSTSTPAYIFMAKCLIS
jgi:hypothetical protein